MSKISKNKQLFLLVLPAMILVFVFCYLPMLGIVIAFKDFNIIQGITESPWVGLKHFKEIFVNEELMKSILNTLVYGGVLVFVTFPFPIILAIMFNELKNTTYKKIAQTISYLPHFISWISVIGIFYSFTATYGLFNNIMSSIVGEEYERVNILLDSKYFLPIIFSANLWKTVGWASVVYLANIAGIDPTLFEAATVDGCNRFKQIIHIILPSLKTTIVLILIMSLGGLFNTNFELVYGFQNVFTQEQTDVIGTVIYRQGLQNGKYSLATAFGLSQGVIVLALTFFANWLSKKTLHASIW